MISFRLPFLLFFMSLVAIAEPTTDPSEAETPGDKPTVTERAKALFNEGAERATQFYGNEIQPRVSVGVERARSYYDNRVPPRVKEALGCAATYKKLGMIVGVPLATAGAGLVYYNWGYTPGEWEDSGTPGMPSMVPKVGNEFAVEERITSITFPRKRTLWVHNGKKGFGKLHVEADKVQYWNGKELVAESGLIAPLGRPYDKSIPVHVTIKDGSGAKIGTVEEVSEEVGDGVHRVSYVVKDRTGFVIGETDEFNESASAVPAISPWAVSMKFNGDPMGEVIRKGRLANSYHWKMTGAEEQVDPRLLIMLSAYKSYVDDIRGDQ